MHDQGDHRRALGVLGAANPGPTAKENHRSHSRRGPFVARVRHLSWLPVLLGVWTIPDGPAGKVRGRFKFQSTVPPSLATLTSVKAEGANSEQPISGFAFERLDEDSTGLTQPGDFNEVGVRSGMHRWMKFLPTN